MATVVLWLRPDPVANLATAGPGPIIVLGDSIAAGTGTGPGEAFPERLSAELGCTFVNAGVPGNTAADALARLDGILAQDPWIVVIEVGGNDFLRSLPKEETARNLDAIVARTVEAGAVPVVLGLELGLFVDEYAAVYDGVAERHQALLVPDLLGGILGENGLMADRIHPNGRGHARIADRLTPILGRLIARSPHRCDGP